MPPRLTVPGTAVVSTVINGVPSRSMRPSGSGSSGVASVGVSSTGIRERVAEGLPIRYLVPDAVVELIEARGLYRAR